MGSVWKDRSSDATGKVKVKRSSDFFRLTMATEIKRSLYVPHYYQRGSSRLFINAPITSRVIPRHLSSMFLEKSTDQDSYVTGLPRSLLATAPVPMFGGKNRPTKGTAGSDE